jgi:hypothetical protein
LGIDVLQLPPKVVANALKKLETAVQGWPAIIDASFLNEAGKQTYKEIVQARSEVLFGVSA